MLHNFSHSALWSIWTYIQVAQMVESLPAKRDTWVQSPSQEDALEKELATHSSILSWRFPGTKESDGLESVGSQRARHEWATEPQWSKVVLEVHFFAAQLSSYSSICRKGFSFPIELWWCLSLKRTNNWLYLYLESRRRRWHPTPVLLPGKSHGQGSLVGCSPWSREEWDMTEWLPFHFSLSCIGEGNGNPLQCSCLENPGDRGAWWAAVYGVAQSQTRLKWLSSSSPSVFRASCER